MKKWLCMLLVALLLPAAAWSEEEIFREGDYAYRYVDGGVLLTDWFGWERPYAVPEVVVVPAVVGGQPVVGLGCYLFAEPEGTFLPEHSIVIPEGVIYLEELTFENCDDTDTVYLPSSIRSMPEDCIGRTSAKFVFPNGNPRFSVEDGFLIDHETETLLYAEKDALGKHIPKVKRLGRLCFMAWETVDYTELRFPDTVVSIGECFYDCNIERLVLPDSVTHLDEFSFSGHGIEEVILPANLEEVSPYSFSYCDISSITFSPGVKRIGEYAFAFSLSERETPVEIVLPETVEFVGYNAWAGANYHVTALGDTHFETEEEFLLRCPDGETFP